MELLKNFKRETIFRFPVPLRLGLDKYYRIIIPDFFEEEPQTK